MADFVSSWKTDNPGTSNDDQIALPLESAGTYDFNVDWGDGSDDDITVWNQAEVTHTYASAGTYEVTITGTITGWGFVFAGDSSKLLDISEWGPLRLNNQLYPFALCSNLTITATDALDLTGTTSLYAAFYGCSSLTTIDASSWDVSSVTDCSYMFRGCSSLTTIDVSSWDVSSVTTFNYAFRDCSSLTTIDASSWDVSSVTTFNYAFRGCSSLTTIDVSSWDVSSVTDCSNMFRDCSSLTTIDVSSWDVSSVTDCSYMFYLCTAITAIDLSNWNIPNVATFNYAFYEVQLDRLSYDALLINFASQAVQSGVPFRVGGYTQYTPNSAASAARTVLTTTYSWTITDGGAAPERFWVGDTDGNWNDANNWALTTGGAGGAGVPTVNSDVTFDDQYTTQNCTCDVNATAYNFHVDSLYDGKLDLGDSVYSHVIYGDGLFEGSGEVDQGDADLEIRGDFDQSSQTTWTAASGTITFTGTSDQAVDCSGDSVGDVIVNKTAGDVLMTGGVTTNSFTGTSTGTGTFDPNGQIIETVGNCDWAADFDFAGDADCMNGCTWTIGGDFTADGQTLNATAGWDLDVTGTAVASGVGAVAYSTAGLTEIDASAGPWTDNGNNSGWNFGAFGSPGAYFRRRVAARYGVTI